MVIDDEKVGDNNNPKETVSKEELNSWKRGFTPQAEIWNGRMAIIGLFIGIIALLLTNIFLGT